MGIFVLTFGGFFGFSFVVFAAELRLFVAPSGFFVRAFGGCLVFVRLVFGGLGALAFGEDKV